MIDSYPWLNQISFGMPVWKWIALIGALFVGIILFSIFRFICGKLKSLPIFKGDSTGFWHHYIRLDIEAPMAWVLVSLLWLFTVDAMELPGKLEKYLFIAVKIMLSAHVIRLVYVSMDAVGALLISYTAKTPSTLDDHLAPLAVKTGKVLVVLLGVLIILQNMNINVMSLLAGLGLGGLALALAAQDAAANLIGSIMILLDRPFTIGDAVKVADVEGTVESIGFRSTRIRTFYNSLVSIPNSTMAKEKIDNMGLRPYRRVRQILGLHYDTPPALIEEFCKRVKYLISQEPTVVQDTIQVAFHSFADSTLNVLVNFHVTVFDINEELQRQQKIFCEIIDTAKEMKVNFAYPTQTVYYMQNSAN